MKHNIEINGIIQEMEFNLGSGILDCGGREIFEGHHVKVYGHLSNAAVREVVYRDGALFVGNNPLAAYSQVAHHAPTLEIMDGGDY